MSKVTTLKIDAERQKMDRSEASTKVSIVIPFYKSEELVRPLIDSLVSCAEEIEGICAEVVLVNDSPDYEPLATALEYAVETLSFENVAHRLVINEKNMGFVGSTNSQLESAREQGRDVILLNSDTVVFLGAFSEMIEVAKSDHMIGFVSPRSNNATICSLPNGEAHQDVTPAEGFEAFQRISSHLPRMTYVPTVVGFCMLIKYEILVEFGVFDVVYGAGYNEENDLVCRAGMVGYRAVMANHAFVWHCGEQSFSKSDVPKEQREVTNRKILLERYPHYPGLVDTYFASPKYRTEQILEGLVPDDAGALKIAFDFSTFGLHHNGTFEAGKNLLEYSMQSWGEDYSFYAICAEDVFEFHGLSRHAHLSRSPINSSEKFAAILRIGQPFDKEMLARIFNRAPVVLISMLDTISQDCGPLHSAEIDEVWAAVGKYADVIASISEYSMSQFASRYTIDPTAITCPSLLSLDVNEYKSNQIDHEFAEAAKNSILLMGNHYPHKAIEHTLGKLLERLPEEKFVTIGIEHDDPRVLSIGAGHMTDPQVAALYSACKSVVFPSYYEGFGLPIMHALAYGKPVFARRMPVFEEIRARLGRTTNIKLFPTTDALVDAVADQKHEWRTLRTRQNDGWARSACDLRRAIEKALQNIQAEKIEHRIRALDGNPRHLLVENTAPHIAELQSRQRNAAKYVGFQAERTARNLFENRLFYRAAQITFRSAKRVRSWIS